MLATDIETSDVPGQDEIVIPVPGEEIESEGSYMDEAAVSLLSTQLIGEFNAAAARRTSGADIHVEHARTQYLINSTQMSQVGALALRVAQESGSGRVRDLADGVVVSPARAATP